MASVQSQRYFFNALFGEAQNTSSGRRMFQTEFLPKARSVSNDCDRETFVKRMIGDENPYDTSKTSREVEGVLREFYRYLDWTKEKLDADAKLSSPGPWIRLYCNGMVHSLHWQLLVPEEKRSTIRTDNTVINSDYKELLRHIAEHFRLPEIEAQLNSGDASLFYDALYQPQNASITKSQWRRLEHLQSSAWLNHFEEAVRRQTSFTVSICATARPGFLRMFPALFIDGITC